MGNDLVIHDIRYGFELVDALTGGPAIGPTRVAVAGQDAMGYPLPRARWAFERLAPDVPTSFDVEADLYLPRLGIEPGADEMPPIPDDDPHAQGVVVRVELEPRTGYPFPAHLTRLVGAVRYQGRWVAGASVTTTPRFGAVAGEARETRTASDGQYTVWFEPDPTQAPALPTTCDLIVEATIDGVVRAATRTGVSIEGHRVCGVAVIELT